MNNPPLPSGLEGYQLVRLSRIIAGDIVLDSDTGDKQPATQDECDAHVFIGDDGRTASGHYVYRKYEPLEPDVPADLAGWQNVRYGLVQDGDLLVDDDHKEWARGVIGRKVHPDGTAGRWRVYRKIPVAKQGLSSDGAVLKNDQPVLDSKAKTYDDGKPPLAWLPWAAMDEMARVQAYGHSKYGSFLNYKRGMEVSRNVSCAIRHLRDFMNGIDRDAESGLSPLGHALCRISFIIQNTNDGTAIDDRKSGPTR